MLLAAATASEIARLSPTPRHSPALTVALPAPTPKPPPIAGERFYRPELDTLRLIAFFLVWLSHSLPSQEMLTARSLDAAHALSRSTSAAITAIKEIGNLGVCIFFFLSAYLITELLRRERALTGTVHLQAFYIRRILRIWPLYLGVLAVYALLGLRFHGFRIEPGRLLASVLLAGNWYIAFHPAILTPMRALWSLSVEEQFYLGWPLLARSATPRRLAAACIALLLVSQGTLAWLARPSAPQPSMLHVTAWVNSLVQFEFFSLGIIAALLLRGRVPQLSPLARSGLGLAATVAFFLAAPGFRIKQALAVHTPASLMGGYLLAGIGCALLFAAVLGVPSQSVPGWSVRLGRISFGLYVFHETGFFLADSLQKHLLTSRSLAVTNAHWMAVLTVNKALALLLTIAIAIVSYQYWEKPFLRFKDRFAAVRSRPA